MPPELARTVTRDTHFNPRGDFIRSALLGATNGLVVVASVILGVEGADVNKHQVILVGTTTLIGGMLAAAFSEYLSVASQRDSERYDIKREIEDHKTEEGRQHELKELEQVYIERGMSPALAATVAIELSEKDAIGTHIRDELGLDPNRLSHPYKAAGISGATFLAGGLLPFLSSIFIRHQLWRPISCVIATSVGLVISGTTAAHFGGANVLLGLVRTTVTGWCALGITYGVGRAIGH